MGSNVVALMKLFILFLSLTATAVMTQTVTAENDWAVTKPMKSIGEVKVTNLHFYYHSTLGGANASSVLIAQAASTNASSSSFGALFMLDNTLTEGPEPTSKLLGRAQGLEGSAQQNKWAVLMAISLAFTEGQYNGSSLSILGRNPITEPVREVPIVGGTGLFRFASGFALIKTYLFDTVNQIVILQVNVTIAHF